MIPALLTPAPTYPTRDSSLRVITPGMPLCSWCRGYSPDGAIFCSGECKDKEAAFIDAMIGRYKPRCP